MKNFNAEFYVNFGRILTLYANSEMHKSYSVASSFAYIFPPLVLKQYILVIDENEEALGYVSWAKFNTASKIKYLNDPAALIFADWCSGDELWFVDAVSVRPEIMRHIKMLFCSKIFPDKIAFSLRVKLNRKISNIMLYGGRDVSSDKKKSMAMKCFSDLIENTDILSRKIKNVNI